MKIFWLLDSSCPDDDDDDDDDDGHDVRLDLMLLIAQIKEQMQSNSEPSLIAYNDYVCLEPEETVTV